MPKLHFELERSTLFAVLRSALSAFKVDVEPRVGAAAQLAQRLKLAQAQ